MINLLKQLLSEIKTFLTLWLPIKLMLLLSMLLRLILWPLKALLWLLKKLPLGGQPK